MRTRKAGEQSPAFFVTLHTCICPISGCRRKVIDSSMHHSRRAVGFIALAFVAMGCSDSSQPSATLGSSTLGQGRFAVVPQLSPEAEHAYATLPEFGTQITQVHVRLTAANGATMDTTIVFPENQDTLRIDFPLLAQWSGQSFTTFVELMNAERLPLFAGTNSLIARPLNLPLLWSSVVSLHYIGPGSSARTVAVSPSDTALSGTMTLGVAASGVDSSGRALPDILVRWTTSDATLAAVAQTGNAAATVSAQGKRGVATITAVTPLGVSGTIRVATAPPATRLVVVSGSGQTDVAGSVLAQPVVVQALAADGLPVPGVPVTFIPVTQGGALIQSPAASGPSATTVAQKTVVTDANGRASMQVALGTVAGSYQYAASAAGLSAATASETATPAPAAEIRLESGDKQSGVAGHALANPLVVKVLDRFGGVVGGAAVSWQTTIGAGTVLSAQTVSDTSGLAATGYIAGTTGGTEVVRATLSIAAGSSPFVQFGVTSIAAPTPPVTPPVIPPVTPPVVQVPTYIAFVSGSDRSGPPNSTLVGALVVRVLDASGQPIANVSVAWHGSESRLSFSPSISVTGANGQASTVVTLGPNLGRTTVTAVVGSLVATGAITIR
jgi:hypothetical protein